MGSFNFGDLVTIMNHENDSYSYDFVLIKNFDVDFHNLEKLSFERLREIKKCLASQQVQAFEDKLKEYCEKLRERCIPVDRIIARGKSGYILRASKYREILEYHLSNNADAYFEANRMVSEYESIDINYTVRRKISNLQISDVLCNFVPVNFTFTPCYTVGSHTVNSFRFTGINNFPEYSYNDTVNLNDFAKLLGEDSYTLELSDNKYIDSNAVPVNDYNDYFEFIKKNYNNENAGLRIDINLRDNNNNIGR